MSTRSYVPDRRITTRISNSSTIPAPGNMAMHRLSKDIRSKHTMHKVLAQILVVKVLSKQYRNLLPQRTSVSIQRSIVAESTHINRTNINRTIHQVRPNINIRMFLEQLARNAEPLRRRMALLVLIVQAFRRLSVQYEHILL